MSSHGLPEVLMKKVDEYVDSLAPEIQPRITSELEVFQQKTIDSLETQVVDAFRSLFNTDGGHSSGASRGLNDSAPDSYGGQSLPFADEIAQLTRSFSKLSDEATDDLRDIFDLTEGRGNSGAPQSRGISDFNSSQGTRGFLSAAINVVQDHLDDNNRSGGQKFELDGLLGVISNTVRDTARNPEEKARLISPEIKEKVGLKLREQHAPIAEQFTRIALDHIKRWLRGNTSTRDLGDGAKLEIEDQVKDLVKGLGGLFGGKRHSHESHEGSSRGFGHGDRDRDGEEGHGGESKGGFSKIISDKLSTGLAKVHRAVRLEFRKILGAIEKKLFELLPDQFQRPLEKILGGNPFDSQLDRDAGGQTDRGFGDDIKTKLVKKIRGLVRKVQETLRESILGVVNGGHRKFELESWVFVQKMVEQKVQKYLPKVKISVPDDIGNEGVSVGTPAPSAQLGGHQSSHSSQGSYPPPPSHDQQGGQEPTYNPSQGSFPPPPSHEQNGGQLPTYNPSQGSFPPPPPHEQHSGQVSSYTPSHGSFPPPPSHEDSGQVPTYNPSQGSFPPPPSHEQHSGQVPTYNPSQGSFLPPPTHEQHDSQVTGYSAPSQYQDYRPDQHQQQGEYRPQQHQSNQEYQSGQGRPSQQYQSQQYHSSEGQGQSQDYTQNQYQGQNQNPQY